MAAGMAKQAVQNAGGAGTAPNMDNLGDLFDEAKIREQASSFGLGVRFVSSEPIAQSGLTGVKATFAFDDVRLLNLNNRQSGASATPTPQLRFDLEKPAADGPTLLRIRLPQGTRHPTTRPPTPPLRPPRRPSVPTCRRRHWRWSAACSRARGSASPSKSTAPSSPPTAPSATARG